MKINDLFSFKNEHVIPTIIDSYGTYTSEKIKSYYQQAISVMIMHKILKGDRLLLILDHDLDAIITMGAVSAIGSRILLPYNLEDTAVQEWIDLINDTRPDKIIYLKRTRKCLKILQKEISGIIDFRLDRRIKNTIDLTGFDMSVTSNEHFLTLFTSGTTGSPKAISISEELIVNRVLKVSETLKFKQDSVILMSGLMNNTTGIIFSLGALFHGSTLIIPNNRVFSSWPGIVEKFSITHLMLRPHAIKEFNSAIKLVKYNLSSLKVIAYGATTISSKILDEARNKIKCEWIQGYGLSETFGPFCWLTESDHKLGIHKKYQYCVGKPDESLECKIQLDLNGGANVGELLLRGHNLMNGYSTKDGFIAIKHEWFHTGDLVELSNDGYIVLKGRIANTIIAKNGHRIYPEEIEGIIREIAGIDDAVLVGIDNDSGSQSAVICISGVLSLSSEKIIKKYVIGMLEKKLSVEKWPEYICVVDGSFKLNVNGKIVRSNVSDFAKTARLIRTKP